MNFKQLIENVDMVHNDYLKDVQFEICYSQTLKGIPEALAYYTKVRTVVLTRVISYQQQLLNEVKRVVNIDESISNESLNRTETVERIRARDAAYVNYKKHVKFIKCFRQILTENPDKSVDDLEK